MKFNGIIIGEDVLNLMMNGEISYSEAIVLSVILQYFCIGTKSVKVKVIAKYLNFSDKKVLKIGEKLTEKNLIEIVEKNEKYRFSCRGFLSSRLHIFNLYENVSTTVPGDAVLKNAYNQNLTENTNPLQGLFFQYRKPTSCFSSEKVKKHPSENNSLEDASCSRPKVKKNSLDEDHDEDRGLKKEVRWMIDLWNKKSSENANLPKKLNKSHGGNTTKVYKETVDCCKQFLNGRLYTTKGVGLVPKKLLHIRSEVERKYTYTEFEMFVKRFMKVLLDREIKPVSKRFVQENSTLKTFLAGNGFGQVNSLLLDFCYTEPETVYELVNQEYLPCIEKAWSKINKNYECSGLNKEILDRSLTLILKIYKRNKIKPEKYKITITETFPLFFKKNWKSAPRVTYLISEAFVENYREFISGMFKT